MQQLTQNAITLLDKRYLRVTHEGKETIPDMFRRVAHALAQGDETAEERYYEIMYDLRFLPNSPTLMNAGHEGTLSACFTFHVPDSLDGIFEVGEMAMRVLKYGGGVGYGLSALRPLGSPIASTGGKARGPLAAMAYYQSIAAFVEQGGKRDGAQMAILSIDHPDVEAFIHAKDLDPQRLNTFNISVAVTDDFMQRLVAGDEEATSRWAMLSQSAWATGDPGCYFIDRAERDNPTPQLGRLESTNPCGEVPLLHAEACNLGSINLARYVRAPSDFNYHQLETDVRVAVRMLDAAITINRFPHPAITEAVRRTRKIGLGVMGWADALALMHIPYDSTQAIEVARNMARMIRMVADQESYEVARESGPYPAWRASEGHTCALYEPHGVHRRDDGDKCDGVTREQYQNRKRNATRVCIAPTGSIAIIAGASAGIEPHYALSYMRTMGDGTQLPTHEPIMDRLREQGSSFMPHTAHEIAWEWHLEHQAAWQDHTDLAVSKTINLPHDTPAEVIGTIYRQAWEKGCKGITVYRDGCRNEQVLTAMPSLEGTVVEQVLAAQRIATGTPPARRKLPRNRDSITHKFALDGVDGYITTSLYPEDKKVGEVFLTINREGSAVRGWADLSATLLSIALQYGVPLELLVDKLRHTRFEPAGMTDNPEIPIATSVPDYLGHYLSRLEGLHDDTEPETRTNGQHRSGDLCPVCGQPAWMQEGCLTCPSCGWTRCS